MASMLLTFREVYRFATVPSSTLYSFNSLRYIGTPSARILKKRAAKRLPKNTQAGAEIVTQEWLEKNFEGDLSKYSREASEITATKMTAYEICAYNKRRWLKSFTSDHEFRRGIVMPARRQIFEEEGISTPNDSATKSPE